MERRDVRITKSPIDAESITAQVAAENSGATVLFLGTVRDHSEVGPVDRLTYEAYVPMAEKRMKEIAEEVNRTWPVSKVKIVHRVGTLKVGDVSEPVKTPFGYHIIVVLEHKSKSLAEVKPDIEKALRPQEARKAVEAMRNSASVQIDDSFFGPPAPPPPAPSVPATPHP